jgi:hypothetical protein
MEKYFDNISSIILRFTDLYHSDIILKVIDSNNFDSEQKRIFFTIILKSNSSVQATNILIRNFHTHNHFHPSIYILLRSILSDIILAEYIISLGKDENLMNNKIHSIYLDHIDRTIKLLDNFYSKYSIWTPSEIEQVKKDLKTNKETYLDKSGQLKGKPLKATTDKLINIILSETSPSKDRRLIIRAYEYYDRFSKYEHFGAFSHQLFLRGFDAENIDIAFNEVYQSLEVIFSALINYSRIWDFNKENTIQQLNNIIKEFHKNNPSTMPCV